LGAWKEPQRVGRDLGANIEVHLVETLNEPGVSCDICANRGWKALSNGELISVVVAEGYIAERPAVLGCVSQWASQAALLERR